MLVHQFTVQSLQFTAGNAEYLLAVNCKRFTFLSKDLKA